MYKYVKLNELKMKKNFDTTSKEYAILSERSNRIAEIRAFYFDKRFEEFARKLEVSTKYASGLCNKKEVITNKTLEKILSAFPDVSRSWLYFGEGEMFTSGQYNQQSNMTVGGDNIINGSSKTTSEGMDTLIATNARLAATLQQQADQIDRLLNIIESKL